MQWADSRCTSNGGSIHSTVISNEMMLKQACIKPTHHCASFPHPPTVIFHITAANGRFWRVGTQTRGFGSLQQRPKRTTHQGKIWQLDEEVAEDGQGAWTWTWTRLGSCSGVHLKKIQPAPLEETTEDTSWKMTAGNPNYDFTDKFDYTITRSVRLFF